MNSLKLEMVTAEDAATVEGLAGLEGYTVMQIEGVMCSDCRVPFLNNTALQEHLTQSTGEPLSCPNCRLLLPSVCGLKAHQRAMHGLSSSRKNLPRYKCKICDEAFTSRNALQSHKLVHADRMIPCEQCDALFSNRTSLYLHRRRVHEGRRDFVCLVCNKQFALKTQLEVHERVHTGERPFACSECGATFKAQSQVIVHKKTHTDERPFECEVCGKRLRLGYNLKLHMRTHTGEKPYACRVCGRAFSQSGDCKKHMRVHHKHNQNSKTIE